MRWTVVRAVIAPAVTNAISRAAGQAQGDPQEQGPRRVAFVHDRAPPVSSDGQLPARNEPAVSMSSRSALACSHLRPRRGGRAEHVQQSVDEHEGHLGVQVAGVSRTAAHDGLDAHQHLTGEGRLAVGNGLVEVVLDRDLTAAQLLGTVLVPLVEIGERQHVGGPVETAVLAIVFTQRVVVGQHHLQTDRRRGDRRQQGLHACDPLRGWTPRELHLVENEIELHGSPVPSSARVRAAPDRPRAGDGCRRGWG